MTRAGKVIGTCAGAVLAAGAVAAQASPSHLEGGPVIEVVQCPGGGTVTFTKPGKGFDPLTATDDALQANGLPPRPSTEDGPGGKEALAAWTKMVTGVITYIPGCGDPTAPRVDRSHGLQLTPRRGLVLVDDDPSGERIASLNYAGKSASVDHVAFDADSHIKVPSTSRTSQFRRSTHWVAVGRISNVTTSYPLVQSGVDANCSGGSVSYNAFYEIFQGTEDYQENALPVSASVNDYLYVHVGISNTSSHKVVFHMVNTTDGIDLGSFTPPTSTGPDYYNPPYYTGGTAAWISERFGGSPLADFNSVTFQTNRLASGGGTWHNLHGESRVGYVMQGSTGTVLADYDSTTTGGSFHNIWHAPQ